MYDILKRPAKVGDRVLTKGYYSTALDTIATIKKVNKSTISLELAASWYDYHNQKWVTQELKPMKRDSSSFVIINEQLSYNHAEYPEQYI